MSFYIRQDAAACVPWLINITSFFNPLEVKNEQSAWQGIYYPVKVEFYIATVIQDPHIVYVLYIR